MKKVFLVVYHKQGEHYDDKLYTWLVQAKDRNHVIDMLQHEKQFETWTSEQLAYVRANGRLSSVEITEADFSTGDVQFIDKRYIGD